MPGVTVGEYAFAWLLGSGHPGPPVSPAATPVSLLVFLVAAICEELGWTGYATDPMLRRWGPLAPGVALGGFWGLWPLVPLLQAHHGVVWCAGWFVTTVAARVIIVWLYVRSGSVLSAVCLHAGINVCGALTPRYELARTVGMIGGLTALAAVGLAVWSWGGRDARPPLPSRVP